MLQVSNEQYERYLQGDANLRTVSRWPEKTGKAVWVEVNEIPVVKNQKTVSIVGSMVDVTEKKLVEEALAEAEDLFRDFNGTKKRRYNLPPAEREKGPMKYIRSLISHRGR